MSGRGRAGAANLVPTSTGAARATTRAVPELAGRFDGIAVRAPIPVGSIADIVFVANRPTTVQEVNDAFRQEAASERYQGVLGVSEDPLVSADIVGDPRAAVIDLDLTRVVDDTLVKVMDTVRVFPVPGSKWDVAELFPARRGRTYSLEDAADRTGLEPADL